MKKLCLTLAVVTSIAFVPVARADSFTLTASGVENNGQQISVSAIITATALGGGEYLATGASGTVQDPWGNTDTITGVVPTSVWVNPFSFDDLMTVPAAFPGAGGPFSVDDLGLVFSTDNPGYDFGLGVNEYYSDNHYQFADNGLDGTVTYPAGNWPYDTTDVSFSLTPAPTPEPSSLMLLGTGLIGLAGLARRRLFS